MISKQILANLRLSHGFYNIIIALLFFYQGWLGLKIKRQRKSDKPSGKSTIKRHRKTGPIIAVLSVIGLFSGLTLILIDKGTIFEYPPHLIVGVTLVLFIFVSYRISKKIKGRDSPFRTPHFIAGISILSLYLIQMFLGLGILF